MAYLKGDKLWLKKEICFKFFDKAMKSIGDHLEALMKRPECKGADTVLMVGGFSESSWLQKYISKRYVLSKLSLLKKKGLW